MGLAGAAGAGFVAVWRDERDGIDGIYRARLDPAGERLGPDEPIHGSDPDHLHDEASVAITPAGALGMAWVADVGRGRELRLRIVTEEGEDLGELALGPALAATPELGPQLTVGGDGGFALSTYQGTRALLRRFGPDRTPRGPVLPMGGATRPALGPPWLAQSEAGDLLAAWNTEGGIALDLRTASGERRPVPVEPGQVRDVLADPEGGWYVLVQTQEQLLLRHRDARGDLDRGDVLVGRGFYPVADMAAWSEGVAVVTEELARDDDRRTRLGPIALHRLTRAGELPPDHVPQQVLAEGSRGATAPRVAASGDRLMVAWDELRGVNQDVYYRILGGAAGAGRVRRLNADVSSSHQRQGHVATTAGGDRAIAVWLDDRSGRSRAYARRLGTDGGFVGDEIALPAPPPPPPGSQETADAAGGPGRARARNRVRRGGPRALRPGATLAEDGSFLLTWKEQDRAGFSLFAQLFDAEGRPLDAAMQADPGFLTPPGWRAVGEAIPGRRGFLLVWVRERVGVCLQRLTASGERAGDVEILSETKDCRNPSIARLDDRRFVVAWDVQRSEKVNDMRGRFLLEDGRLTGHELRFTRSRASYDSDPAVAPAGRGFLLAWVARRESDRDVFARFYSREGAPQGRPLAVTTLLGAQDQPSVARLADGSWAVAWRDDLSGTSHGLVRRVGANRQDLGPVRRLHPEGEAFIDETLDPVVASLGDGLLALWTDVRRSSGFDVVYRVLGPAFDAESGR